MLLMDKNGIQKGYVYFGEKSYQNNAVVHSGDNLTGEGDGDDEIIKVDLSKIPEFIDSIWSVITIYTSNM